MSLSNGEKAMRLAEESIALAEGDLIDASVLLIVASVHLFRAAGVPAEAVKGIVDINFSDSAGTTMSLLDQIRSLLAGKGGW